MEYVMSKRALGLIKILGGSLENLMPLTEFSSATALRHPGLGLKTVSEVRALLIDNDLDFKHDGCPERGIDPIAGYSDKVDLFISTVMCKPAARASRPNSKTMKRLLRSQDYYEAGLMKTKASIRDLNEKERNFK